MQDHGRDTPRIDGGVKVDGTAYPVCIRPRFIEKRLVVSNFRPKELWLVYQDRGPHISIDIEAFDFVSKIAPETMVSLPSFYKDFSFHGQFWMAEGRLACDVPTELRRIVQLTVETKRAPTGTAFEFMGQLSERRDSGDWPASLELQFWFVMPDAYVDFFIPSEAANTLFRRKFLPPNAQRFHAEAES